MNDVLHWLALNQADGISNSILIIWFFLACQTLTSKKIGHNLMAVRAVAVAAIFIGIRVVLANALFSFPDPTGPQIAGVLANDYIKILWHGAALVYTCLFWGFAQWHRVKVITKRRLILEGKLPSQENKASGSV